jgi:hypothetical protein
MDVRVAAASWLDQVLDPERVIFQDREDLGNPLIVIIKLDQDFEVPVV